MEKTRKTDWLMAQGYRMSSLPLFVTWHFIDMNDGQERELKGRTDNYNLDLYRRKGYVLDMKYLDPQLWNQLEYRVDHPRMTVAPLESSGTTPRLAKAIKGAVGERDFWQGTPSELLALIDSRKQGIPKDAARLSVQVMTHPVTAALKSYGISVDRKRTATKRLLQLKSITQ